MAVIHELPPHLADLIAAGEVVERPASVAKELVENAIDAGASRISVEIQSGGISYLRVTDDGKGMAMEDAQIAFRRHATSKIRREEDLSAIGTLGFRGEALAAISAVSRIDLLTKEQGTLAGTHLHVEASQILACEEAGCPEGTSFIVRDLFFNTPARMKFLKKDFTEAGYVQSVVQNAALSHPEIAFSFLKEGKTVFQTAGDGKLLTPVFGVFGKTQTEDLLEVPRLERETLSVWGYISKPHAGRANRNMQYFFVNGRYVKNRTMQVALEEAYRNRIITGKYPSGAIFLNLPLSSVDVNVHPAKTEVKFAREKEVFEAVYIACKNTLDADENAPLIHAKTEAPKEQIEEKPAERATQSTNDRETEDVSQPVVTQTKLRPFWEWETPKTSARKPYIDCDDFVSEEEMILRQSMAFDWEMAQEQRQEEQTPTAPVQSLADTSLPSVRVIGEAFRTYILAEDEKGLLLIDKHAAHERILFNEMRKTESVPEQRLLSPQVIELTAIESTAMLADIKQVRALGFDIEPFGSGSFMVRGVPAYLDAGEIASTLSEIATCLLDHRKAQIEQMDDLLHTVACKAAIKAGSSASVAEMEDLCKRVLTDAEVSSCPHGRPVLVRLTKYELDKMFKRVNQ